MQLSESTLNAIVNTFKGLKKNMNTMKSEIIDM